VKREVIAYGSHDAAKIEALVAWSLPYAQRYIKQHHVNVYNSLDGKRIRKLLKRLRFVVVDQLFFRYSLQYGQIHSSGRTECGCLFEVCPLHESLYFHTPACYNGLPDYVEYEKLQGINLFRFLLIVDG
jgi:hypothetical protein